jgi:PAS domain S-box-containing protein
MSDGIAVRAHPHRHIPRLIGLVTAFLLILANEVFALFVLREIHQASARVEQGLQAMLVMKEVENLAVGGSRDQRTYRMFGDPRYLDDYREAQLKLPAALARLLGLITSDQAGDLERLRTLIDQDSAALEVSIAPVQSGTGFVPPDVAATEDRSDAIVASIGDMLENERKLLSDRLAAIKPRNIVLAGTVALATLASIGLVGVIFLLMRRDTRQSDLLAYTASGALRESELRFRRVFEESPLGKLLVQAGSLRILQANAAICKMLGFDADELIDKTLPDLSHPDDRALLLDAVGRATDLDHVVEVRCLTRSGGIAWGRVRLTQLSASDGHQSPLLAIIGDITREILADGELRQAQKMEAIGQLTGGIAHDFNNLLGVIIGNAEFLLDAVRERPDEAALANEVLNSALSGADLTRRLLAVARRQALQPRRINLNLYLPNHVAILRRVLGGTTRIATNFARDLWPTRADPSQVGDALLNLAINARDAMPHGGSISIEAANLHVDTDMSADDGDMAPGDYVVLAVTDTGTGMAPELVKRAVEPFFSTKGPEAGSGLGLSMIYGFARQSGGHLRIDSEPGHGTTVRLYLPRALGEEADHRNRDDCSSLPGGYESILLVDDNAEMRAVGRRHLTSLGYRVTEAENGPAALALLQGRTHYDLLFTDVVMPHGMTGYQLAAAARELHPGLKVLFVTGYAGPEPRTEPARATPGATIRKPYRRQELALTTRAALEG